MEQFLDKDGFLTYKGRPLVRCKDTIYYGSMSDPYVVMIRIVSKKDYKGLKMADKLLLQLMDTDPKADITKSILKKSEKTDLYDALDVADIWLTRQDA